MKLLILTQYFPPETGAPQNRLFELAVRLKQQNVELTVLTAMPNYPQMAIYPAYSGKKYHYEEMDGLKVHRSSIYVSKNKSIIARLRNYFSFVFSSIRCSSKLESHYDFLMCESPPLFLGYSAMYLARVKKAKLIFNVSDLWPESAEKLGVVTNKTLLQLAYHLEKKLYKKSTLVTGQTQGICENIQNRFPNIHTYWLPNGVDLNYYNPNNYTESDWRKTNGFSNDDFILFYGGIIGIAQGLEVILLAAKTLSNFHQIKFVLLGNGPEKPRLEALAKNLQLKNIYFFNSVSKTQMPLILKAVNASIIPLRKLDLFKGAIPSKIFENLAMQVPIILGVDGEAKHLFIDEGNCGLHYEPENAEALSQTITKLYQTPALAIELGKNGRVYVNNNFNRERIAELFYKKLISL